MGWIAAAHARFRPVYIKFSKTDEEELQKIIEIIAEKLIFGLSADSESNKLTEFYKQHL